MNKDPIVEEVREARQKIFEKCGQDLDRLLDWLKGEEKQDSGRIVSFEELQNNQPPESAS